MPWTSTRTSRWVAVACLLAACSDAPVAPERRVVPAERSLSGHPRSPGGPPLLPEAAPDSLRAWFAERGVTLPADPQPLDPAAKVAQDQRLLGDGDGNGRVNYSDLLYLWGHLTRGYSYYWVDFNYLDIDRDGDNDWDDLSILGKHLYANPRPPNTYGIGRPLTSDAEVPDTSFDIELEYVGEFSARYKHLFELAAGRWEAVIVEGLPDFTVDMDTETDISWWEAESRMPHLRVQDTIDDVRIYVGWSNLLNGAWGQGGAFWYALKDGELDRPILGKVLLDPYELAGERGLDIQNVLRARDRARPRDRGAEVARSHPRSIAVLSSHLPRRHVLPRSQRHRSFQ